MQPIEMSFTSAHGDDVPISKASTQREKKQRDSAMELWEILWKYHINSMEIHGKYRINSMEIHG